MSKIQKSKETCIIFEFTSLPDEIKKEISSRHSFRNDIFLEHISELSPSNNQYWSDVLKMSEIEDYYKDQVKGNNYKGDLDTFIKEYGLVVDKFFIDKRYKFDGIKKILFKICW